MSVPPRMRRRRRDVYFLDAWPRRDAQDSRSASVGIYDRLL